MASTILIQCEYSRELIASYSALMLYILTVLWDATRRFAVFMASGYVAAVVATFISSGFFITGLRSEFFAGLFLGKTSHRYRV